MDSRDRHPSPCCVQLAHLRPPPTPPDTPPPSSHPTHAPSSFASLPTEILTSILSYLDPPTLAACTLTSRAFLLPLASATLYRRVSLRNQRDGKAAPQGSSALDRRSTALISTLSSTPALAALARCLDFDLLSHLASDEIAALLSSIFRLCPSLISLRLGVGAHGHGFPFKPLHSALLSSPSAASTLRTLDVQESNGAPHTLAAVLVRLTALTDLRVGAFLLEPGDFDPSVLPTCRLRSVTAERGRLTPCAWTFLSSASGQSLRTATLPLCERAPLDLAHCDALAALTLFITLSTPVAPAALAPGAPQPAALARLARNFTATVESVPYLASLTLKGTWDAPLRPSPFAPSPYSFSVGGAASSSSPSITASLLGGGLVGGLAAHQPLDIVRHAKLLHLVPRARGALQLLIVRTEVNALALCAWLADEGWWSGGGGGGAGGGGLKVQVWQRVSYSKERREFQARLRKLALRVGAPLVAKKYDFGSGLADLAAAAAPAAPSNPEPVSSSAEEPAPAVASGKNKKKKKATKASAGAADAAAALPPLTFTVDDILNLGPVVKSTNHRSALVDETFHHGRRAIEEGQVELGEAVVQDAMQLAEQVFGPVHPEQASKLHSLGIIWHPLAQRVRQQLNAHEVAEAALKEISDADRPEHEPRIRQYADLGLLEHAAGNSAVGLKLTKHAMDLWAAAYGPRAPSLVSLLASIPLQLEHRKLAEAIYGADSAAVGRAEHSLGQTYAMCNDLAGALEHIKAAHKLLSVQLGEDAKEVTDAAQFIRLVEASTQQAEIEQKAREERFVRAQQDRLNKRFPTLMASQAVRSRVGGAGAALNGAPNGCNAEQTQAPAQRQHGQKADLPLQDLVQ
ncbi:hypothetical protein JCM10207_006308 [Rhodosporidiobolus poonsookiae]